MKKLLLIAVLLFSITGIAQEGKINWMSVEEAMEAQKKEPRKMLIDMYTTWCGPCRMLDKMTFKNKDVADYVNKNYYAVKFNAEGDGTVKFNDKTFTNPNYDPKRTGRNSQHQFATFFKVNAYPTVVFLDEKGTFLFPSRGVLKPQQMELYLKLFASNDYKKVTTKEMFQEYAKKFKPQFKE